MTLPDLCPLAIPALLPDAPRADGQTFHGGPLGGVRGLVLHVTAGNGNPRNWWTAPSNPSVASAHFGVMKDGTLYQYVRTSQVAWAQVAGNGAWHSVETEGWPYEPLTAAQVETLAHLYAWGHGACGWALQATDSVDGAGFGWHGMGGAAWGGHTGCPGDNRKAQRAQVLTRAAQLLAAPAPAPAPPAPAPAPVPAPAAPWDALPTLAYGDVSTACLRWEQFLVRYAPGYARFTPATRYGDATAAATAEFQRRSGIPEAQVDGRHFGPLTKRAAWAAGYRG